MRTIVEIKADLVHASETNDAIMFRSLAEEAEALGTPEALAHAERARGMAFSLTGNYAQATDHFKRGLSLFNEVGDVGGVASVTAQLGMVSYYTGNNQHAVEQLEIALAMFEEQGDRYRMTGALGNLGIAFYALGDYPQALRFFEQSLAMNEDLGNQTGIARMHGNIGALYSATSDYPSALKSYEKALELGADNGDLTLAATSTGNVGLIYSSTGDYEQALEYLGQALDRHKELGDQAGVARVTGSIGGVYNSQGNAEKALEYCHKALSLYQTLGDRTGEAHTQGTIVSALIKQGSYELAQVRLEEQSSMLMDNLDTRGAYHFHRAHLYEHNNDLEAAHKELQTALSIVEENGLRDASAEVHKRLRDLAQKRNDFASYIEHNNEYTRITEEVRGKEATQKMAMMQAERTMDNERRERDKERALLHSALPKAVAERMLRGEAVTGDHYDHASVMFLDVVGFTTNSHDLEPRFVTELLDTVFHAFDELCEKHNVTKIKTIGDAYLAVAFPEEDEAGSSTEQNLARVSLAIQQLEFTWPSGSPLQFRIGLHSGPVVAGVIGKQRLQYDVWGDTVNVASRMESSGEAGRIHVSEAFATVIPNEVRERGTIDIKGKGPMKTFWLEGA